MKLLKAEVTSVKKEREKNCKLSCDKLTAAAEASFAFEAYVRNVMLIDFR